ncbi:hypothetical protein SAMN04487765_1505 [Tenacibaculum sp. MAR_2010_89]|uniref:hypothetical protein n=1 Tax=Tenacibaculum sp. MAR_2010_89 TaxID=1250198 RepID=UPI0008948F81|nr:hypothetical protein [Tenacibaculum sp. MAR_2010_89]SEE13189.1 hypothetical protein SAMN04487765_1505 [Tenacibaculum sp. MAR_2010_89]
MKKQILTFGVSLNKEEQKSIKGGDTVAQIACRQCLPGYHFDFCDMQLACDKVKASVED